MTKTTILKRPIITEKSSQGTTESRFTFEVSPKASKGQIKQAVEEAFKVNVLKINTMFIPGKTRRSAKSRRLSQTSKWKKAIVQLKSSEKIDLFEIKESK